MDRQTRQDAWGHMDMPKHIGRDVKGWRNRRKGMERQTNRQAKKHGGGYTGTDRCTEKDAKGWIDRQMGQNAQGQMDI